MTRHLLLMLPWQYERLYWQRQLDHCRNSKQYSWSQPHENCAVVLRRLLICCWAAGQKNYLWEPTQCNPNTQWWENLNIFVTWFQRQNLKCWFFEKLNDKLTTRNFAELIKTKTKVFMLSRTWIQTNILTVEVIALVSQANAITHSEMITNGDTNTVNQQNSPTAKNKYYKKFHENLTLQQFKVIQGHRSWCRWKAHMWLPISH